MPIGFGNHWQSFMRRPSCLRQASTCCHTGLVVALHVSCGRQGLGQLAIHRSFWLAVFPQHSCMCAFIPSILRHPRACPCWRVGKLVSGKATRKPRPVAHAGQQLPGSSPSFFLPCCCSRELPGGCCTLDRSLWFHWGLRGVVSCPHSVLQPRWKMHLLTKGGGTIKKPARHKNASKFAGRQGGLSKVEVHFDILRERWLI